MAFPCHLLNFWRSPILLWQPQQRGSSLEPHTPQSNSTQAHPNQRFPALHLQLELSSILSSIELISSSCKSASCPTKVYTGGLKSMFVPPRTVVSSGLGRRSLESPANGVGELELESPIQLLVLNEEVGLAKLDVHPTWWSRPSLVHLNSCCTKNWCDHPSNTKLSSSLVPSVVSCDLVGLELLKERHEIPCVCPVSSDLLPIPCA
ncbi:unnamed protein product [Microthlaspi erraticum]|uniref:Uncharacterized protein n=1 Tax=Microthlaspi erraticum TaxID=1685480 RepID=A0A6D2I814_9BRAS|nr:unnamed protein product [Microthlaspi erraticum]